MTATNLSHNVQTTRQATTLATVATVGVVYFAVTIAVLHFLRPDLNPIRQPTSAYAVGPHGFLMTTAFFSMSVASFALVIGLYQTLARPARSSMGLGLLGLWGLGVLIAMIFPMDPEGAPQTLSGTIHQTAGPLTFLSMALGASLLSWRLKHDVRWRPIYRTALTLSLIVSVGFIATFVSFITESGFLGLTQRITLAAIVAWLLLAAVRILARR